MREQQKTLQVCQAGEPKQKFDWRLCRLMLVWVLLAGGLSLAMDDLRNFWFGPFALDSSQLLSLQDLKELPSNYVQIEADEVQVLFASAYTPGKKPYSNYGLLQIGKKKMLVHLPGEHEGKTCVGLLEPFTPFEQQYLLERCRALHPDHKLLPFRLNMTRPYREYVVIFGLVPLFVLAIWAVWLTIAQVRHFFIIMYFQ